jgi:hypothetical protein
MSMALLKNEAEASTNATLPIKGGPEDEFSHCIVLRSGTELAELLRQYCHHVVASKTGPQHPVVFCYTLDLSGNVYARIEAHLFSQKVESRQILNIPHSDILFSLDVQGHDPRTMGFFREES